MPFTFTYNDQVRSFSVHMPWQWVQRLKEDPSLNERLPMVVCLHGSGVVGVMPSITAARTQMQMEAIPYSAGDNADDLFFVLYLQGVGLEGLSQGGSWNSGHMDLWSRVAKQKDLLFIQEAVSRFVAWAKGFYLDQTGKNAVVVDPNRRYLVGFGNGGCMAYYSAATNHSWAGFAVVNGCNGGIQQFSDGNRPVVRRSPLATISKKALLHVHASGNEEFDPAPLDSTAVGVINPSIADLGRIQAQKVPSQRQASVQRHDLSVVTAISDWIQHNHGVSYFTPSQSSLAGGTLYTWAGSGPMVQHLRYPSNAHSWPNPTPSLNRLVWDFFRQGQLP